MTRPAIRWRVIARYPRPRGAVVRRFHGFPSRDAARRWVRLMRAEVPMVDLGPIRRAPRRR